MKELVWTRDGALTSFDPFSGLYILGSTNLDPRKWHRLLWKN